MKILVSSKSLYAALKRIDFDGGEEVQFISLTEDRKLMINTNIRTIELPVEILSYASAVSQSDVRWDWLRETLRRIEEQPVIVEIKRNIVNLIFQY
jgi:hypothetical protein